jgi:hypothetical protein
MRWTAERLIKFLTRFGSAQRLYSVAICEVPSSCPHVLDSLPDFATG